MPANTDYLVAWSPKGLSAYGSSEYITGIEQYWKDLQADSGKHTNVDSTSAQYGDATGAFAQYKVTFGGLILDTDPYPASQCPAASPVTNCLTDAQIQAEVQKVAAAHHIPHDLSARAVHRHPAACRGLLHKQSCLEPAVWWLLGWRAHRVGGVLRLPPADASTPLMFYSDDPYVTGNSRLR